MRELFSSPLVTQAAETVTVQLRGAVVSIARRDHFCAALQSRLGLPDAEVCQLQSSEASLLQNLSFGIPGAGYTRGAASALMPREPNLFFTASVENLCSQLVHKLVDPAACPVGQRCWSSTPAGTAAAIADFVQVVMAVPPSDARRAEVQAILVAHHGDATRAGHGPSDALKSTFVLACTSPFSNAIGL